VLIIQRAYRERQKEKAMKLHWKKKTMGTATQSGKGERKYKRRWLRLKLTSGAYVRTQQSCVSLLNEQNASVVNESLISIKAETVSTGSMISDRHHGNSLAEDTKQLQLDFFYLDDNTRITTGKNRQARKITLRNNSDFF